MHLPVSARLLAAATVLFGLTAAAGAGETADRPRAVIEFFTSQGCSSCPPADEVVAEFAARPDVVALAYHVDYWDYLGWRDTLASAENTARQYDYSEALGQRSVYTPQAVVNGSAHVNGADRAGVDAALAATPAATVEIDIRRAGDSIVIEAGGAEAEPAEAHVLLVYFDSAVEVEIGRGENGGRTIAYHNAVRAFHSAGMWRGRPERFEMPAGEMMKKATGGCAAILQEVTESGHPGAVLGAAVLRWDAGS